MIRTLLYAGSVYIMSRSKNVKRNIIWGVTQKVLSVLLPFFVRTALIYSLGAAYVGLNSLFTSILSVLSLAELGFASAVAFSMYEPIAKEDKRQVLLLLQYFRKVCRAIGIAILVLGLCLMPFLDYMIEGAKPEDVNLQVAFAIFLANTVISYLACGYRQTLLDAYQRNDVVSKVNTAVSLILNLTQIVLITLVPNYYLYALALPLLTIAQNMAIAYLSNRLYPEYRSANFIDSDLNACEKRKIRKRVAGIMVYRTCQITRDSFDSIFISAFLGLTVVACYSNYFLIVSSLLAILEVMCSAMTASVGNSIASESSEKNFKDMRLFMFLYATIATVCLACFLSLCQLFMTLWVGDGLLLSDSVVILLGVYFYVRVIGDIRSVYVDATGLWWELKGRSILEALLNIVLDYLLVQVIGVAGAILATVVSMLLINYFWGSEVVFSHYFKNKKLHIFFLDNALYTIAAVIACSAAWLICSQFGALSWIWFVIKGIVAVLSSSAVLLILFFKSKRFKEAWTFIRRNVLPS